MRLSQNLLHRPANLLNGIGFVHIGTGPYLQGSFDVSGFIWNYNSL